MRKLVVFAALAAVTGIAAVSASAALRPGVYQATIRGATPAALNGTWRMAFNGPAFGLTRNNVAAIAGTITLKGNKITFRDLTGPYRCGPGQTTGTYTWALKGTTLTFKVVSDKCAGRKAVLARAFRKLA